MKSLPVSTFPLFPPTFGLDREEGAVKEEGLDVMRPLGIFPGKLQEPQCSGGSGHLDKEGRAPRWQR